MPRQIFSEVDKSCDTQKRKKIGDLFNKNEEVDYYPNCDASIWMRSCDEEVLEPLDGKLTGYIPNWLSGTLLRNGPGSLKVGDYEFDHLFDSSALLHRFHISKGRVTYQSRFVATEVFKRNQQAKRIVMTEFGTRALPDPCQTIFQRIAAVFDSENGLSDNSMISIYPFGDEYYTFAEAPFIHRIDLETLETKDRICVTDYVGIVNHTSHPLVTEDGTVFNVGMSMKSTGPAYAIVSFPSVESTDKKDDESNENKKNSTADNDNVHSDKKMFENALIVGSLPARWKLNPSYMHTFGLTNNYFIIVEQPLAVALLTMMACKIKNEPMCSALKWHENENTMIHVISRKTGKLAKSFVTGAFFYLHMINQYENENDEIVVDICCYRDAQMLNCMYVDAMKNMHKNPDYSKLFRARPLRFILPMKHQPASNFHQKNENNNFFTKKSKSFCRNDGSIFVEPELLCNLGCETPRYNQRHLGKKYRYFYAISSDVDAENPGTIIKVDTFEKTAKTWSEEGLYPSEPIFVEHPEAKNEDDGIILSAAIYGQEREHDICFLILDAKTMTELGRVTFCTPGPVPKCLHGWFAPGLSRLDNNNNNEKTKN